MQTYFYFSWNILSTTRVHSLRPRQNRRHFADDVFKCNLFDKNVWIAIKISLKFVPKGSINNIPALVQIMAWRRPSDKPLSEPMMVSLLTHICVTRPQWVNLCFIGKKVAVIPVPIQPAISVIYLWDNLRLYGSCRKLLLNIYILRTSQHWLIVF